MTMPYIHSKASVCVCMYTTITLKPQEVHSECHMCSVMANTAKLHQRRQAAKSADMALIWQVGWEQLTYIVFQPFAGNSKNMRVSRIETAIYFIAYVFLIRQKYLHHVHAAFICLMIVCNIVLFSYSFRKFEMVGYFYRFFQISQYQI